MTDRRSCVSSYHSNRFNNYFQAGAALTLPLIKYQSLLVQIVRSVQSLLVQSLLVQSLLVQLLLVQSLLVQSLLFNRFWFSRFWFSRFWFSRFWFSRFWSICLWFSWSGSVVSGSVASGPVASGPFAYGSVGLVQSLLVRSLLIHLRMVQSLQSCINGTATVKTCCSRNRFEYWYSILLLFVIYVCFCLSISFCVQEQDMSALPNIRPPRRWRRRRVASMAARRIAHIYRVIRKMR